MSSGTPIQYCIPADGDDFRSPNVFLLSKPAQSVTVGDIRRAFPLPGAYVFRFKRKFQTTFGTYIVFIC